MQRHFDVGSGCKLPEQVSIIFNILPVIGTVAQSDHRHGVVDTEGRVCIEKRVVSEVVREVGLKNCGAEYKRREIKTAELENMQGRRELFSLCLKTCTMFTFLTSLRLLTPEPMHIAKRM